jgi:gamma-glutamylcyclotransferase (GGCT)/AIG2-like uncharacterized protein YtfP
MPQNKIYIAVYGSLRVNQYNFERFKSIYKDGINYEFTSEIFGWKLHSLGSYPAVNFTEDANDNLIVDVLSVSEECFASLNRMEIGAGYVARTVTVRDTVCTIWEFNHPVHSPNIKHGDWSKYVAEKKENSLLANSY